jgi:hypothetical protein
LLFGCALAVFGCGSAGGSNGEVPEGIEELEGPLLGYSPGYWTSSPTASTPAIIPVCFENATSGNAAARADIQNGIERSWQRYGRVNFTNWGQCALAPNPPEPGIHILLTNLGGGGHVAIPNNQFGRPHVDGVRASNAPSGMRLDPNGSDRIGVAMHEFGHALGFGHEESRDTYTGPQCNNSDSQWNGQDLGAYDDDSIMSYCRSYVRTTLSPNDTAAFQRSYGRRIKGQFVSRDGFCLAANSFNPGNPGPSPFLWTCDEFQNDQEWYWSATSPRLYAFLSSAPSTKACVTDKGSGNQVKVESCTGASNQAWRFQNVSVVGWGGLCLDLPNGNTANGTHLQVYECLNNANQLWNITDVGEIRFAANTNKCVTVKNWGTANGTQLTIQDCIYPTAQKFRFAADRFYWDFEGLTKCIDSPAVSDAQYIAGNDGPANGWRPQVWDCISANRNQNWNFYGQLKSGSGRCLARSGDGNGVNPTAASCSTSTNQKWDYYFK